MGTFLKFCKLEIRKFLCSFRYRKLQIRKVSWLIPKFLQNAAQLCPKTVLKVVFEKNVYYVQILISSVCAMLSKEKKFVFVGLQKF